MTVNSHKISAVRMAHRFSILLSTTLLFTLALHGWTVGQQPARHRYALVIGISRYEHSTNGMMSDRSDVDIAQRDGLARVQFADSDACAFAAMLSTPACGGFPSKNILLLTNEQATRRQIEKSIAVLADSVGPNDILYFYFAGHGAVSTIGERYLLPYDVQEDDPSVGGILMADMLKMLAGRVRFHNLICFIDVCHSEGVVSEGLPNVAVYDDGDRWNDMPRVSIAGLFSSGLADQSYENPGSHHGRFTEYLLRAMGGDADRAPNNRSDGRVTGLEAYRYIFDNVRLATRDRQLPRERNMDDDFVLSADSAWPRVSRDVDTASLTLRDSARSHMRAGDSAFGRHDLNAAIAEYRVAIGWLDAFDTAHYKLGLALSIVGRNDEAADALRRSAALNPAFARAHYELGRVLLKGNRTDEAMAELVLATAQAPGNAEALYTLAMAEEARGDLESAANDFDRFARSAGGDSRAKEAGERAAMLRGSDQYLREGRNLLREGAPEAALERFYRALRVYPKSASAYYEIGAIHFADDAFETASEYLMYAVQLDANNINARYLLGRSYERLSQPSEARVQYRAALKMEPDSRLERIIQERLNVLDGD